MPTESLFEELKRYVGFVADDEARLRALHPALAPHFKPMADDFYAHILDHEGARNVITGGMAQVERLKLTLMAWMDSMLQGPWDEAYFTQRARIGRRHVIIGLPQHYMLTAMDVFRVHACRLIADLQPAGGTPRELASSLHRIMDMELAIHLHTYQEDYQLQAQRHERLATYGQLVASIGHELRNPLGVMESSVFLLRGRVGTDERVTKHLDRLTQQIHLSNRIITDLLDIVRERPLSKAQVDVCAVIESALESLDVPEGVTVVRVPPPTPPVVQGDAGLLRQVFSNLLGNALDAVGEHGTVRVSCVQDGGSVVVLVEDTGPGISPLVRSRLFEPLITTKPRGVGLGLALVKHLVERHGGKVLSGPPRDLGGALFSVTLPTA